TCGEKAVAQGVTVEMHEDLFHLGPQLLSIGDAILVARKALVGAELRLADLLAEFAERAVVADADEDQAVAGLERFVRCKAWMRVALRYRRLAGEEIVRRMRMHHRKAGFEQRRFEKLSEAGLLPLIQRHQNADGGVETGRQVHHRNADACGTA